MQQNLILYNSLTRTKETFIPINPPSVGLYVCGPTVYGNAHLGHARSALTFDILFRYLNFIGYKVRYVRNITDVGHLENDADSGEDKIEKKAKLESLEPMEIVQLYTLNYHKNMELLNMLPPSIEPRASGHILEQLELIDKIHENGYAYQANGSVYFDVEKYNKTYQYGKLSGRVVEQLLDTTRVLDGQTDKKNPFDFALWKKASDSHIMKWNSKWSDGYPGWHLECTAMSAKYLGEKFDIHGGGLDLLFPHHECEIAQSAAAYKSDSVTVWMHNNLITINGQKMGKSLGNAISLEEFFSGNHPMLTKAYHPMIIRFFILQAHYRSPLDFSNEALLASEKGLSRLFSAIKVLNTLSVSEKSTVNIAEIYQKCIDAMNDDLNTPIAIAHLFDAVKTINLINDKKEFINSSDLELLKNLFNTFIYQLLGLKEFEDEAIGSETIDPLMQIFIELRKQAKQDKNFGLADAIRTKLQDINIVLKDTKEGTIWEYIK